MNLEFFKYHACGNDYIYIDCFENKVDNPSELSKELSKRHFGIGSDGLVLILPSDCADAKMRIFNADGSEAKMCGNGIRCVSKYLFDRKIPKNKMTIDTLSGIKNVEIVESNKKISQVRVDMGDYSVWKGRKELDNIVNSSIDPIYVSVGNPHCVIICDNLDMNVQEIGSKIQKCFNDGINVEFVKVNSREDINVRVFERGSGETLACGTGSCASSIACNYLGLCDKKVTVHLLGGTILVECSDKSVFMTGEAVEVFKGEFYV